jgi:hypothetical protein
MLSRCRARKKGKQCLFGRDPFGVAQDKFTGFCRILQGRPYVVAQSPPLVPWWLCGYDSIVKNKADFNISQTHETRWKRKRDFKH